MGRVVVYPARGQTDRRPRRRSYYTSQVRAWVVGCLGSVEGEEIMAMAAAAAQQQQTRKGKDGGQRANFVHRLGDRMKGID